MSYFPSCNNRYGPMGSRDAIQCERAPGHKGAHQSRTLGVRWANHGSLPSRCTWVRCTAPDRRDVDGTHVCPGSDGEKLILAWWPEARFNEPEMRCDDQD